jgi:general secretion pathway protein G
MRYTDFLDTFLIRSHSQKCVRAFTLVELLLAIAILATLSAIAVPSYTNYMDKGRNATAMADIGEMELVIARFQGERGRPPNTLAEAGVSTLLDPWGRPYQYLVIWGVVPEPHGVRKDHHVHPINTDYDLYSMGKDGRSQAPLTANDSHDDIIRANDGRFVGLASDY